MHIRPVIAPLLYIISVMSLGVPNTVFAKELIIDDRSSGNTISTLGPEWRLFTDTVMGGVSTGNINVHSHQGKNCLRLRGNVSTENNGGFVQMALPLSERGAFDASGYDGVEIEIAGNNETYNIHFRTADLWFPWQSYRASFTALPNWQTIRLPFAELEAYKTSQAFQRNELKRIGLLGIGRNFKADLCLASIRLYSE